MEGKYVPDWRKVTFPNGRTYVYKSLEKANNARILAKAWENFRKQNPSAKTWTHIAKATGTDKKPPYSKTRVDYAGTGYYVLVVNGKLPKDEESKQKIFDLAGYPWD